MFRSTFYKFLMVTPFLTCMFCNNESGVLQSGVQYGAISGKILHPDNNLFIRMISEGGVDTTTRDPESQTFTFDSIKCGKCILQVRADGYGLFEEKFILNKPQFICHDIVLAQTPPHVSYLFPSNSQNLDSVFFSLYNSSITDTGFLVVVSFGTHMDTVSVKEALTILPDTVGVQTEVLLRMSLIVFFPYWKLATIDTVKVSIGRGAVDEWGVSLDFAYTVFYPVDTNFIRTTRLDKK